ncbi:MAG TPA: hypothetical protein VD793_07150 [Gemmatimonadales bacterium]|nr:hypothetical protein [Gemmatimonadales bacterium]
MGLGRRGASRVGCLISLVVAGAVVYYGMDVVRVYFRYWQMRDEMRSVARLAPSLDDATILRRLRAKADALALPQSARRFTIRRLARPREIRITTSYNETVVLPFYQYTFQFKPEARAPL